MREEGIEEIKYLRNLNGADWGVFIEKADILVTGLDYNERWLSFKVNDFRVPDLKMTRPIDLGHVRFLSHDHDDRYRPLPLNFYRAPNPSDRNE